MSKAWETGDMLCDDVTEEVAKNTILTAMMLNLDPDLLTNTSLQSRKQSRQTG